MLIKSQHSQAWWGHLLGERRDAALWQSAAGRGHSPLLTPSCAKAEPPPASPSTSEGCRSLPVALVATKFLSELRISSGAEVRSKGSR